MREFIIPDLDIAEFEKIIDNAVENFMWKEYEKEIISRLKPEKHYFCLWDFKYNFKNIKKWLQ